MVREGRSTSFVEHEFLVSENLEEVCHGAVDYVNREMAATSTAIFLFSKHGRLVRHAIAGFTPDIPEPEEYSVDTDNLTGRSVIADAGEKYAGIRSCADPIAEWGASHVNAYKPILIDSTVVCLPLNGPNRTYGTIRCVRHNRHDAPNEFSDDDLRALSVLAHQTAITISSIRRKLELQVSSAISSLITENVDIDLIFQRVANNLVSEWTDFAACSVRVIDRNGDLSLVGVSGAKGVSLATKKKLARDPDAGLPGRAFTLKEPVIVEHALERLGEFADQEWIRDHKFETAGLFPIVADARRVGTLMLFLWYDFNFSRTTLRFIEGVCQQLAAAAGLARLVRARDELVSRLHDLASPVSSEELLQRILNSARDLTGGSEGYIALTSRHDAQLHPTTFTGGVTAADIPTIATGGKGLTARAIRENVSINCSDVRSEEPLHADFVDLLGSWAGRVRSELVVPMTFENRVTGVIVIESERRACFHDDDVATLQTLAGTASLVYQRQRFHDATARLASLAVPRTEASATYDAIVSTAVDLAGADAALLCTLDTAPRRLKVVKSAPNDLLAVPNELSDGVGLSWAALAQHSIQYHGSLSHRHGFHHTAFARVNRFSSMVTVPLHVAIGDGDARVDLGVLNLFYRTSEPLLQSELQVLRAFSVTAAHAVYDADVLHERERRSALAATTARLRAVMSVSEAVNDLLEPVRHLDLTLRRMRRLPERAGVPRTAVDEALRDVRTISTAIERITPEGKALAPHVRAGEPTERVTRALKTLSEQWMADTIGPRLHITSQQLWATVRSRLARAASVLNLDVAVAYMADRSDYTDLKKVAQSRDWRGLSDSVALSSFDQFARIERDGPIVTSDGEKLLPWLRSREVFGTDQAVLYAKEAIGGHLLLLAFGFGTSRTLSFPERAILHEIVTQQLFAYIDNAMFGLELDHFTSETGHLMGRAVGKVRGGIEAIEEVLPPAAAVSNLQYKIGRRSIDDGITRLEMIRQNFYSFSVQRRSGTAAADENDTSLGLEDFDVIAVLQSMRQFFEREAHEANLRHVQYDVRAERAVVRGVESLLRVTFLNLIDNAVKFAYKKTYITVRVRLGEGECIISFENLGVGVAPGEEKLVFQRLRKSRFRDPHRRTEGLGMGLSFCRRVVEGVFHGRISLSSRAIETRGDPRFEGDNWLTIVTLTLPCFRQVMQ